MPVDADMHLEVAVETACRSVGASNAAPSDARPEGAAEGDVARTQSPADDSTRTASAPGGSPSKPDAPVPDDSPLAELGLRELQTWFLDEIRRPHEGRERSSGAPAPTAVAKPSATLAAEERVAIYSRMYMVRLLDCLAADYPAVRRVLGDEDWCRLAHGYLVRHPSSSWTLNRLGRQLPEYLAAEGCPDLPRRALALDLARLEQAMSRTFDAFSTPPCTREDLAHIPQADWPQARFVMTEPFTLLAFDHRANAIVSACLRDRDLPDLGPRKTWVALYRKDFDDDYRVWRMDLTEPMYAMLSALAAGHPLADALLAAFERFEGPTDELQKRVFVWLDDWMTEGLFADVVA